eukprot:gene12615-28061_t
MHHESSWWRHGQPHEMQQMEDLGVSNQGLLGNLGNRSEGVGAVQIDGKYGSDDRHRMLVKGCGFNFELALVYSAAAGVRAYSTLSDV